MSMPSFMVKGPVILDHMIRRGLSRKELARQADCDPRHLRMVINEGRPVSDDLLTKLGRALGVTKEELLEDPADRALVRGSDSDAAINRFFATMFSGLPGEALKEFCKRAKLHLHVRSRELLSLIGASSRRPGEFVGRDEIGEVLQKICSIARVEVAKELRRTPMPNDRVLVEGWVKQAITANDNTPITYDFVLVFEMRKSRIQTLHIHFDTQVVEEGLRDDLASADDSVQANRGNQPEI